MDATLLDAALADYPRVFGEKLRAQRQTVQATFANPAGIQEAIEAMETAGVAVPAHLYAAGPMPEIAAQVMSLSTVSEMLEGIGVSVSADDLASIEAGTYPNLDVRLTLALMFVLEFSIDAVLIECLQTAAGSQNNP